MGKSDRVLADIAAGLLIQAHCWCDRNENF